MSKNIHDIDNLFKQSIDAYRDLPRATLWDAIDKKLDKKQAFNLQKKYNNLKKIAAVLLVLLLSSVAYYQLKPTAKMDYTTNKDGAKLKDDIHNKSMQSETETAILRKYKEEQKNNNKEQATDKKVQAKTNITNSVDSKVAKTLLEKNFDHTENFNENKNNIIVSQNVESELKNKKQLVSNISRKTKNKKLQISEDVIITENENIYNNANNNDWLTSDVMQTIAINKEPIALHTPNPLVAVNKLNENSVASKNANKKLKASHRFSATAYISPEFAFNRLADDKPLGNRPPPPQGNNPPPPPFDDKKRIKEQENKATSFSAGVLIEYAFAKKWSIQLGINYSAKTTEIAPKKVFAENDNNGKIRYRNNCSFGAAYIDPKTGTTIAVGDSAIASNTVNKVHYIGVPFNINYHFTQHKFSASPFVGVAFNFLANQKVLTGLTDATGTITQQNKMIEGLKKHYANANVGVQFGYAISKKLLIIASPNFKFALSPVNKNAAVKAFPNTFGLMAGVKVNL
jgi:hypothetical protein